MRVLVTGGAGYIGSVVVEELVRDGHEVVALDTLDTLDTLDSPDSPDSPDTLDAQAVAPGVPLVRADLRDRPTIVATLRDHAIEVVVHVAADGRGDGSVVDAGLALLDAMVACEVKRLVLSSSAAVYGEPAKLPIEEHDPTVPTRPFGEAMLALERALPRYEAAHGLRSVTLRCFNAAGASDRCGERHEPGIHIIPRVLQAAAGLSDRVMVFGHDYPTSDRTCIRDYVHVVDLARAHVLALALAGPGRGSATYNVGSGEGHSVLQVIDAAWRVTGEGIPVKMGPRRPGDPAVLVASIERIERELGWRPTQRSADPADAMDALDAIVDSAWKWMQSHPHGHAGQR